MLKKIKLLVCFLLLISFAASSSLFAEENKEPLENKGQPEQKIQVELKPKKRVAVLPFITAGIEHWWLGSNDPGLAMSEYLVHELVNSGQYTVIEREQIEKIFKEHNLSISGEVDPTQAIEIGQLLGAEYLIIGKLTEFMQSTAKQSGGGFGYGGFSIGGRGNYTNVRVTAVGRAVNTVTGQIASSIKASDTRQASGGGSGSLSVEGWHFGGHDQENSTGGALGDSMQTVAKNFVNQLNTAKWETVEIREKLKGFVINIDSGQVILNIGSKDKVAKGMRFKVYREISITDPISNKVITIQKPVAELKVIDVQEEVGICEITKVESSQEIKLKDTAKEM